MSDQTFQKPDEGTPGFNQKPEARTPDDERSTDESAFIEIDGRKFSKEDVIKKLQHADSHISTLEKEQKEYRDTLDGLMEQVDRIPKLEEALEKAVYNTNKETPEINLEEVIEKAKNESLSAIEQRELEEKYRQNITSVANKLREEFGEDPDREVFDRAAEVGYTRDEAFELAGRNPKAFYRLIGLEGRSEKREPAPTKTEVNTAGVTRKDDTPKRSIMDARTTKERISIFNERLEQKKKELGLE